MRVRRLLMGGVLVVLTLGLVVWWQFDELRGMPQLDKDEKEEEGKGAVRLKPKLQPAGFTVVPLILNNTSSVFSKSQLLELCNTGSGLQITHAWAKGAGLPNANWNNYKPNKSDKLEKSNTDYTGDGPQYYKAGEFLGRCFPVEIASSQAGRSMGHCADYINYILHADARLSTEFGWSVFVRKAQMCPNSTYLHGEYPNKHLLDENVRNVWMPNLEQISHQQMHYFAKMHTILCKTRATCVAINKFLDTGLNGTDLHRPQTIFMSHSSPDTLLDVPPAIVLSQKRDFNAFIHTFGSSGRKSSFAVFDCWEMHPEWPTLILIGNTRPVQFRMRHWSAELKAKGEPRHFKFPKNVRVINDRLDVAHLRALQYQSAVHICPSEQEGYGHYINEARSLGSVVLTTAYPPMNEFVQDGKSGILINHRDPYPEKYQGMSPYFISPVKVDHLQICEAVEKVMAMSIDERMQMGRLARLAYEYDTALMEKNLENFRREANFRLFGDDWENERKRLFV
ncbi:hypothetical protein HK100_012888 [Physocladia obscura]|uniref:Glycosyl transferase family 1 domain-containing protein n=1 Tax=Physocladia obscura TaxID=109957 RepID=A0AAD5SZ44_9FUNG|nr:hypothetical protein HK100_012888 [Physocladia obscura]